MLYPTVVSNVLASKTLAVSENNVDVVMQQINMLNNKAFDSEAGRSEAFTQAMGSMMALLPKLSYDSTGMYLIYDGSIAIVPLRGALINRFNTTWGFITGYHYIRGAISAAMKNSEITGIVLDIDSHGGEVAGCFETSEFIAECSKIKPVYGYVDSNCHSAAYAIGSGCAKLYATPSANVGSIGVVAVHTSYQKYLENEGVKVTIIKSGDKKYEGNQYEDLTESAKADIQADIDASYGKFKELVASNRNIDISVVADTQAACYNTKDALSIGLIDGVCSLADVLKNFDNQSEEKGDFMTKETEAAAASTPAVTPSASDERTRIKAILTNPAAANASTLAEKLAYETDMPAAEAVLLLEAAATDLVNAEQKAEKSAVNNQAVADSDKPSAEENSALAQAMATVGSPKVGADKAADKAAENGGLDISAIADFANNANH